MKVFPATLTSDGKKMPLISNWQNLASDDPAQLKLWQEFYRNRLSFWGVPCGPINDMLVLDIDVKTNGFKTLQDMNLGVPNTMVQTTLNGGQHYIFKYPTDGYEYGNKVGFLPGLDVRSRGGWIAWYGANSYPMAYPPQWLLDKIKATAPSNATPVTLDPQIAMGIFQKCLDTLSDAAEGERNHTLNTEAFKVGQLLVSSSLSREYAVEEMTKVARSIGLDANETRYTLRSALKGGVTKPLTCPFPNTPPVIKIHIPDPPCTTERWTPRYTTKADLLNNSLLRKPQLFKDWSTEDIHIVTADGGTGKTTLILNEAVSLALGERFLGFDCKQQGKSLFITGEDTAGKLRAMTGAILKQMSIFDGSAASNAKLQIILQSVLVKKESDMCLITKEKNGFIRLNPNALGKVMEAVEDIRPKLIVFDPISSFWGSEAALNDMNKAVVNFMHQVQERSGACVLMVNHMGKVSSQNRDMTQFAGRGGTGLPSHSRVSRVLRGIEEDEFKELTGEELPDANSAMLCMVNKFTDGSPLIGRPFLIVREGFLFYRKDVTPQKMKDKQDIVEDIERVYEFIKEARLCKKYVTKAIIVSHFMTTNETLSEARTKRALTLLQFGDRNGERVKESAHPDVGRRDRVFVIEDLDGNEKYC